MNRPVKKVLFMSNGHGEDMIAARIIQNLVNEPGLEIRALPIVGTGAAYSAIHVPLILGGENMPSGGFVRNGIRNWMMDLRAGLLPLTMRQIRALRRIRREIDAAVCVGDNYLTLLAGYFLKRPLILLPTAKSDYVSPHWAIERRWMQRFCHRIFTRDAITAESLARYGLPAEFLGNVMMDSLDYQGDDLKEPGAYWTIGILPGSRFEAYDNLEDIAQVIIHFTDLLSDDEKHKNIRYLVALAGSLGTAEIIGRLGAEGWNYQQPAPDELERGISGYLDYEGNQCSAVLKIRVALTRGRFADVLAASDLIVGLAGTGNEQAVGLGKPVITFAGRGPQFTPKFVATQKKLLGDSISLVERNPEIVAREMLAILTDPIRQNRMSEVGRERMGGPGGARRIAQEIVNLVNLL